MSTSIVAQRYANAFFTCVKGHEKLDEAHEGMEKLGSKLAEQPVLGRLLNHPGISREEKKTMIDTHLGECGLWVQRLLYYLVDEGRTTILSDIQRWFGTRYRDEQGIAEIELTTAIALQESALEKLLQDLEKKLAKRVVAKTVVDPDIIGGLVIRHEGMVYDGSVRTMLQQVNRCLGGGIGL